MALLADEELPEFFDKKLAFPIVNGVFTERNRHWNRPFFLWFDDLNKLTIALARKDWHEPNANSLLYRK